MGKGIVLFDCELFLIIFVESLVVLFRLVVVLIGIKLVIVGIVCVKLVKRDLFIFIFENLFLLLVLFVFGIVE